MVKRVTTGCVSTPEAAKTPTSRLANNQIIAAIRISRDGNSRLIDRTTREGLVHNHEYHSLTQWFVRVLALLEEERYRRRPREETKPEEMSTLFEPFDMSDVVAEADKQLGKTHPVTKLVKQKDADIREGVKRLQEHYSRVLLAAGFGQLVDMVIHEIGAPLGRVTREVEYLEKQTVTSLDCTALDKLLGRGRSRQTDGHIHAIERRGSSRSQTCGKDSFRELLENVAVLLVCGPTRDRRQYCLVCSAYRQAEHPLRTSGPKTGRHRAYVAVQPRPNPCESPGQ